MEEEEVRPMVLAGALMVFIGGFALGLGARTQGGEALNLVCYAGFVLMTLGGGLMLEHYIAKGRRTSYGNGFEAGREQRAKAQGGEG